jgi:hypothetical protein
VWIADLLPDAIAPRIAGMIEAGLLAIERTLERGARRSTGDGDARAASAGSAY